MIDIVQNSKARAKRLRAYLSATGHSLSHSESLEAIAQTEGHRDWNTYSALSKAQKPSQGFPLHVGARVTGTYRGAPFEGTLLGLEQTINKDVWRAKFRFDHPVSPASHANIGLTRQMVRCEVNCSGISVNLLGKPSDEIILTL